MANYHEKSESFYKEKGPENLPLHVQSRYDGDEDEKIDDISVDSDDNRGTWGRKAEYILSALGYCVGFGNVLRFPYVCMRNGGGAFLLPYLFFLLVCGLPLYFLEVSLGQFRGKSVLHIFEICPLLKGIGISTGLLSVIASWFQSILLAWVVIYLVNSFRDPLPWSQCGQSWNSDSCVTASGRAYVASGQNPATVHSDNATVALSSNLSQVVNQTNSNDTSTASEEFWVHNVLEMSESLADPDGLPWHTTVALAVGVVMAFLCLIKGIKSVGKVVYVTATLPYILILILIIKGATLPGAGDGVIYYVKPNFSKLTNINTWLEACLQVIFSLGPTWGGIHTMASYNKFNNNCLKDSVFLTLACEGTSVFAGIAVFTVLGHMSYTLGVPIDSFSRSGAGLAFVVYPEAISYMPIPQLWGVLFFLMLFFVGLDSAFVTAEVWLAILIDKWPKIFGRYEVTFKVVCMVLVVIVCLPFASRGGLYLFQLTDWYVAAVTNITIAILECVMVTWIYGHERFRRDIELMLGYRPPYIFVILWGVVTPLILTVVFITTLLKYEPPTIEDYEFTGAAQAFGWLIAFSSFIPIPAYACYMILISEGTFWERLKSSCKATSEWKPADPSLREAYLLEAKSIGV